MARLTVSIVTYHTPLQDLDAAIASVAGADEVWIIDNAADSFTQAHCSRFGKQIKYLPSANNGYGAGHNKALQLAMASGSDYHLVVNADVCFHPSTLTQAVGFMEERRDIGLLHPRLRFPGGGDQHSVRLLPSPLDLIVRRFLPASMFGRRRARYELRSLDRSREIEAAYVQGSFMLLRIEAIADCGLFDERFFMYPEDIDLSRRIAASNRWKVIYAPQFEAIHNHAAASYRSWRMLCIHIVNMIRYFNKWGWIADQFRRESNRAVLSQI